VKPQDGAGSGSTVALGRNAFRQVINSNDKNAL
jgi:hypothetical protein